MEIFIFLKDRKTFTTNTKALEKSMESEDEIIEFVDDPDIVWWIEVFQILKSDLLFYVDKMFFFCYFPKMHL